MQASFWNKVKKTDTCWLWTGALDSSGYGNVQIKNKMLKAHRVSYGIDKIPKGLQLDHLCRVRHCVRPEHLEPVTQAENLKRGVHYQKNKKRCPQGHSYNYKNTHITTRGWRRCRACYWA